MLAKSRSTRKAFCLTPQTPLNINDNLPLFKLSQTNFLFDKNVGKFTYNYSEYFNSDKMWYFERVTDENGKTEITEMQFPNLPVSGVMDVLCFPYKNVNKLYLVPSESKTIIIQYDCFAVNIVYNNTTKVSDLVHFFYQILIMMELISDKYTSLGWMNYALEWVDQRKRVKLLRGSSLIWGMLNKKTVLTLRKIMRHGIITEINEEDVIVEEEEIDYVVSNCFTNEVVCIVMIQNQQTFEMIVDKTWTCQELRQRIFIVSDLNDSTLKLYRRKGLYILEEMKEDNSLFEYVENEGVLCVDVMKTSNDVLLVATQISFNSLPTRGTIPVEVFSLNNNSSFIKVDKKEVFKVCLTNTTTVSNVLHSLCIGCDYYAFAHIDGNITVISNCETVLCDSRVEKIGVVRAKTFPYLTSRLKRPKTYKAISLMIPNMEVMLYVEHNILITTYQTLIWKNGAFVRIPHNAVFSCIFCSLDESTDLLYFATKDIKQVLFKMGNSVTPRVLHVYTENKLLFPRTTSEIFAFRGIDITQSVESRIVDPMFDFQRIGVVGDKRFVIAENIFKTFSNDKSSLVFKCESYPEKVLLPFGNYDMGSLTNYRAKGRFPIISWVGPNMQCLARSSQPLVGTFGQNVCDDDIQILESLKNLSPQKTIIVFDARPKLSAKATRIQGGGMETQLSYPFCTFVNLSMDGIKEIKQSFYSLLKVLFFGDKRSYTFVLDINNSKWLQEIDQLISYSIDIAKKLYNGSSILIHCRNGWDITCQLISLVLIMLDPYYRTIEGFLVLIQREWISAGHRFSLRTGCGVTWAIDPLPSLTSAFPNLKRVNQSSFREGLDSINDKATSPIFFQFLEAVHLVLVNGKNNFQFNDKLLIFLADSLYDAKFSWFFENTVQHASLKNTLSLPSYILSNVNDFLNPSFIAITTPYFPSFIMSNVSIWEDYYFRNNDFYAELSQCSSL
ncbi:myotubularin, putative [Entamoeba invadens IP1]|uniref:Myotubularin, putative n=1 Tax=Entamoeba invadens IP1 TaxID=370355 RepID=A0A0A1UCZ6_ENTIV|nr:myotubularin, putative [Entamoeba invadens IP1]ELP90169.1 myotubularin, putative [Entamoeba invadens IP1]|eukprot:XP_004256940.1 myotubularin, putative [Entamoeba invadens IP1]